MRYRIVYRVTAQNEATDAAAYIARKSSVERALIWFDGFEAAVESLGDMPRRFGFAREHVVRREPELRQMLYQSHRVIYTILGDEVHVLHVRHAAMDELVQDDIDPPQTNKPA